jgi:hypothetical protein
VPAHINPASASSRQNGDDIPQFHVASDAPALRDLVRVETDLQLRTAALHLVENPLPRRANSARG